MDDLAALFSIGDEVPTTTKRVKLRGLVSIPSERISVISLSPVVSSGWLCNIAKLRFFFNSIIPAKDE